MKWLPVFLALAAAVHPAHAESITRADLPNGMRVLIKSAGCTDVVAIDLLLDISISDEPPDQAGIRALTHRLLLRGLQAESGAEVVRRLAEIGGFMDTGIGLDYLEVYAIVPADGFEVAVQELAAVVRTPAFDPQEIEAQRRSLIASLQPAAQDPFQDTYRAFRSELYRDHPYGRPVEGYPRTLATITRDDLLSFHSRFYRPRNAVLAVCGGVTDSRAARAVRRAFGDWQPGPPRPPRTHQSPEPLAASSVVVRELPVQQLYLVLGFPAPAAAEPGYFPLQVLDALLSGGNTALLPAALRDRAGLAYQSYSFYPTLAGQSHIAAYAVVDQENVEQAKDAILDVLRSLIAKPISPSDLERAKRYLAGSYLLSHQRMKDQAYALAWYELLGLGSDFDQRYLASVQAVTAEEVQNTASSVLSRFVIALGIPAD